MEPVFERVDESVLEAVRAFDERVYGSDAANPFLVSFLHERNLVAEAVAGTVPYEFFVLTDSATDRILARCGINLAPPEEDICGYGPQACELFARGSIASLVGDLVDPDQRGKGIQQRMLRYRLERLEALGYDYAVAGILEGNAASFRSCERAGFAPIGEKRIVWGGETPESEPFGSLVTLLALRL